MNRSGGSEHSGGGERAFLVHRAEYGEADWIVTLFTERLGVLSAVARAARRSRRRFGGSLEPLHTLRVEITERHDRELATLVSAEVELPRFGILGDLEALQAAGRALSWVRRCIPPHAPEPAIWQRLNILLGDLDAMAGSRTSVVSLASFGVRLLSELGWALELDRCVRCGKPCPPERSATVSPAAGGLVCRACGGARHFLNPVARSQLAALASAEGSGCLDASSASQALLLLEETLRAHAGVELERPSRAPPKRRERSQPP